MSWNSARQARRALYAVTIAMLCTSNALAQSPKAGADNANAAAVGAAFLGAVTAARWDDAASLLDLAWLDSARRERAAYERFHRTAPAMTVAGLMRANPDMPRSVAVYEAKRMAKEHKSMNFLRMAFGIEEPDSLLALPIDVVARRWVEIHDQRWQNRELHRDCEAGRNDELPAPTFRIISTTVDGDRAYMLFEDTFWQAKMAPLYSPPPRVMQLVLAGERWRILPRGDFIGLPEMVKACG
jgi:hypothetical protein